MASKTSNFSDLIHRVAASCLLHPLARVRELGEDKDKEEEEEEEKKTKEEEKEEEEEEEDEGFRVWEEEEKREGAMEKVREMERVMEEVFDAVSVIKRAYVSLQEAHCPWDPEKMRVADVAVVAELRRLGKLRERFRRGGRGGGGGGRMPYREAAAVMGPYEVAVEELKSEVKAKEAEVEGLKEKLRRASRGRFHHQPLRRVSCITQGTDQSLSL